MITASIVAFHTPISDLMRLLKCAVDSKIDCIYIVDNSSDDSLREIQQLSSKVKYIHSLNLGFGHGHNIAIKKAIESGAKYHVVINPDIYWTDPVIKQLSEYMDANTDCGWVMPRILYPNGDIQHVCKLLPTPINLFARRFLPFNKAVKRMNDHYEMRFTQYDKEMQVPSLSGCFMFLRVDVLKQVGMFDERFFMYMEDLDLCRRVASVSRTMFFPKVAVYHVYEKGSYKNKKLLKYHLCSSFKYFNKWGWIFDKKRVDLNKTCIKLSCK